MLTADESSDEEFTPLPQEERLQVALSSLSGEIDSSVKLESLKGTWVLHETPAPFDTTRMVVTMQQQGSAFEGRGVVSMVRDSATKFNVHIKGSAVCGHVVQFTQTLTMSTPPASHTPPEPWQGLCTVLVDETSCYFSGTYVSGHSSGVVTGALTTAAALEISSPTKHVVKQWPPHPPELVKQRMRIREEAKQRGAMVEPPREVENEEEAEAAEGEEEEEPGEEEQGEEAEGGNEEEEEKEGEDVNKEAPPGTPVETHGEGGEDNDDTETPEATEEPGA